MQTDGRPGVRRIEAGLPPSSPEESSEDDDRTMEEASNDEPAPAPGPVAGFTMAQAHYEAAMVEEEQPAQPALRVSAFRMLQEEQRTTCSSSSSTGSRRDRSAASRRTRRSSRP